jgi:hypothetical protein
LKNKCNKKRCKTIKNNKKNKEYIWYKINLKSNIKRWNWKQNSIRKRIKKQTTIKKMKTKFDIKIKWNQMKDKNKNKKDKNKTNKNQNKKNKNWIEYKK